jgi:hypothetical protein
VRAIEGTRNTTTEFSWADVAPEISKRLGLPQQLISIHDYGSLAKIGILDELARSSDGRTLLFLSWCERARTCVE